MMLWLAIISLTAVVAFAIGRPLLRVMPQDAPASPAEAGRRAVYADQLAEIDADVRRGVIAADDAEAARIEVARRLLGEEGMPTRPLASAPVASPASAAMIVGVLPVVALALYGFIGEPRLPGQPHAGRTGQQMQRQQAGTADIEKLIAHVEGRLREAPQDGRGWDAIAPVYLRVQRYDDAKDAFARAMSLLGETPKRLIGFAESAIRASDGIVTDEARGAFEKVLKAEPGRLEARFWLALAREQRGETAAAADEYRAILAAAPADAPWRDSVNERLAAVTGSPAPAPVAGQKGPTAADAAAAATMTPEARQQMIAGMVDGLHQRLKSEGKDASGWQKLLRAYAVMGDRSKAVAALAEARKALADDKSGLDAVEALAREMGLGT